MRLMLQFEPWQVHSLVVLPASHQAVRLLWLSGL